MKRRAFVAAAGSAALLPAAAAVAVGAPDVDLVPSDVAVGDDRQELRLAVTGVDADRLVVSVDVTPLATEANVGLSALAVDAEAAEVHGADLAEAAVAREDDRVRVRLTFAVAAGDDAFRADVPLVGLKTEEAVHTSDLAYEVDARAAGDGSVTVRRSDAFDVVNPARREPELTLRAERLELGATDQELSIRIGSFPPSVEMGVVDVAVSAVTEAGVDLSGLAVDQVAISGGSRIEAAVRDPEAAAGERVVRVAFELDDPAAAVEIHVTLTGMGTDDAEPTEDVPYYALVAADERPTGPPGPEHYDAVDRFDVVDPDAIDARRSPGDTPQPEQDEPDGGDGGDGESADRQPGFGAAAALAALAALVARRLGADE